MPCPASLYWYFYLGIAARRCRVHGSGDGLFNPPAHKTPTALTQDYQCDFPVRQILLVSDALVTRHQKIESRILSGFEQIAILEQVPASGPRFDDRMSGEHR